MTCDLKTKVFAKKPIAQLRSEVAAWRTENPSVRLFDEHELRYSNGDVSLAFAYSQVAKDVILHANEKTKSMQ
jgi:hypothetical protein